MQHELIEMSAPTGLDARWKALAARDAGADGTFVYAVTSTGVYCRPSCPSRRPRADRVKFFDTGTEARREGFRPCKRCKPDQVDLGVPGMEAVRRVSAYLAAHADQAVTLAKLGKGGHVLRAYFLGSDDLAPSSSKQSVTLVVSKPRR